MPNLKIFIDGEQRHVFEYDTIEKVSTKQQPKQVKSGNYKLPAYRFRVQLKNGTTYSFYCGRAEDCYEAFVKYAEARAKEEDVTLDFSSQVNSKYLVVYQEQDGNSPHLEVYIGDYKLFSTSIEEITEKAAAYNRDEPCSITIAYRNPDPYVDGAKDDPRENDVRYTIIVDSEQMVTKNDELYDIVDGRKEGPIYFDAALNPELLPK